MAMISDFRSMNEVLVSIMAEYYEGIGISKDDARKRAIEETGTKPNPMHVLTTKNNILGASMLAVPDVLKEYFQDKEWIILLSSIHEVVALPANEMPIAVAQAMTKEVNTSEAAPVNQLSGSVYILSMDGGSGKAVIKNTLSCSGGFWNDRQSRTGIQPAFTDGIITTRPIWMLLSCI